MSLQGSVTANAIAATFTFPGGITCFITAVEGKTDDAHKFPHSGTDFGLFDGTPIECLQAGHAIFESIESDPWGQVFGISVIVQHGDGTRALYAHMQEVHVKVGDLVAVGDILGLSGHTGYFNYGSGVREVDPHLHIGLAPDSNPWFRKDADGGCSRLLDPLANLSAAPVGAPAPAMPSPAPQPDAYDVAAHQAAYLADSNARLRDMLEQRVPKFILEQEVATGARLQAAIEAAVATIA